jgi:quercetin dioxygenase-like cupin family protein
MNYTHIASLLENIPEIPPDSILSRTVYSDDQVKVVLFGFAPGQELSEHTASTPAVIQILDGEAEIILGSDSYNALANAWIHMQANLSHSIIAKTNLYMLLYLLKS